MFVTSYGVFIFTLMCISHSHAIQTGRLRLVGGINYREGRLEILHEGKWGTICNTSFGINDAKVACKEFGFRPVSDVQYYTAGDGSGTIWLDKVVCRGYESSLTSCRHNSWGNINCTHANDIGIRCIGNTEGQVRLAGRSHDQNASRLEIFHNGEWGTVCGDGFSWNDSIVVCRQLQKSTTNAQFYKAGGGSGPIWLNNIMCEGTEQALWGCNHDGWGNHDCSHEKDVGVKCYSQNKPTEGDLQLADGTPNRGRLEVYHNGKWGNVCGYYFSNNDAIVACRQLGFLYPNVYVYYVKAGSGPKLLTHLRCNGTERRLDSCKHNGWGKGGCSYYHHAGIVCMGNHKINGAWGVWSEWSHCDRNCGTGNQTRTRLCDSPAPSLAGSDCHGSDAETKECKLIDCPVHGHWSSWTHWGSCDVTCGKGFQIRARYCDNPKPSNGGEVCHGDYMETHPCYDNPCPDVPTKGKD